MQEASAQCTALPTAQLPAQLAASLLQAAFQALILLQGTREEGGEKKSYSGPWGGGGRTPRPGPTPPTPSLTSVPCGPGLGPARPAGSPATPAPLARAALGAAALWSSASLGMEVAEGQEAAGSGTHSPTSSETLAPTFNGQHRPKLPAQQLEPPLQVLLLDSVRWKWGSAQEKGSRRE